MRRLVSLAGLQKPCCHLGGIQHSKQAIVSRVACGSPNLFRCPVGLSGCSCCLQLLPLTKPWQGFPPTITCQKHCPHTEAQAVDPVSHQLGAAKLFRSLRGLQRSAAGLSRHLTRPFSVHSRSVICPCLLLCGWKD